MVFLQPSRPTKKPLFPMENILSAVEYKVNIEFSKLTDQSFRAEAIQLQEKGFV